MVNIYNTPDAFEFLSDLNKKIKSDSTNNANKDSAIKLSYEELEKVLRIVEIHNNFCIDSFTYDDQSEGFAIYNMNDKESIKNRTPELQITENNLVGSRDIRKLHEATMDINNIYKTRARTDLNTHDKYYTKNGMPKYNNGLRFKELF